MNWHSLLKKAWDDSFERAFGVPYADTEKDIQALNTIAIQAERRRWDLQAARNFFDYAIKYLETDPYWGDTVTLLAVSRRINETYIYAKRKRSEELARGDFKASQFRRDLQYTMDIHNCRGQDIAKEELAKIRSLIDKATGGKMGGRSDRDNFVRGTGKQSKLSQNGEEPGEVEEHKEQEGNGLFSNGENPTRPERMGTHEGGHQGND